jgi:3-dehydrotetronate 4-kinase
VADALIGALGCGFALACPAFPTNARSVYLGHLFAGGSLLNESGMENHPLTPMKDANLVRVLSRQTEGTVGLVPFATVEQGAHAVRDAMTQLKERGRRYAIVDAITDAHLVSIGEAAANHALITGGSGVAMGLPANFRRAGLLSEAIDPGALPGLDGASAVIAGSCSRATLAQLGYARAHLPVFELDALATPDAAALSDAALAWAADKIGDKAMVIAASAPPEKVAALQERLGREQAGALIEDAVARVAEGLVARGVRKMVVAGGETSGAIVARLGVRSLRIGGEIDPGVPWTLASGSGADLMLALKSGNFGATDFFLKAFRVLEG